MLVCRDLNSRTGEKEDNVKPCNINIFVKSAPDEFENEQFMERISKDTIVNSFGNRLLHICKETGLRIVNGRLHNDECIGNYTCYNNRGSIVVDYLLTNYDNFDNVIDFMVGDANEYSKHAPISFSVKTNHTTHTARTTKIKNIIRLRSDRQDEYIGVIGYKTKS